ncbi:MAG: hypothetical protein K6B14_07390 [Lachnospiraceae bacterium]|nr:hypothetical protein [Lachnospiraceae bacterium]
MIISQNTKLNVIPGGIIPVVNVSQYDVDRAISFTLYDGNGAAVLDSGTTVSIEGTKPDGHGFQYAGTLTGNVASFNTTLQMTVLVGAIECKLTLRKGSQVIGTAMFILDVEKAGINESTVISDTDIPMIISLATEQMERAEAAAVSANASMIASGSSALIAGNAAAICSSILPVVRGYAESAEDNAVLSGSYMRVAGESAEDAEYWAHYAESHAGTGHVIVNQNGQTMPQREKLKFLNCNASDDSANNQTVISAQGGGGSSILISTNESTLHGKTVTVTGTSETKTATIGNDGKAVIDGFMDTGSVTISASDGTDTATVTISIPYFGNYAATLSFWAATLSISTDSPDLYGQTITVKDNNNQTVATSVFSGQGTATATVNSTGTYTVSATGDGVTVTESVTVSAQTTYNVSLHLWTATVSISTSSSELYSATITVKKGGSTVGTTSFSAQGSAIYKVHETGEYTFECSYSGQTYSDSVTVSAETSYSVTINTVPDGSTVTPTDDIQTWLACAGITDKNYTTLAEVLADTDTYHRLLQNSNACDYMVRSTSWATKQGLVPTMTSDTTPSGVASASNVISGIPAYFMFTGSRDTNTSFICVSSTENIWVKYEFDTATVVKMAVLSIRSDGTIPVNPIHPKIQGSNDDINWTDIAQEEITLSVGSSFIDHSLEFASNNTAYKYLRILFPEVMHIGGSGGSYMNLQYYAAAISEGICDSSSAMSILGMYDYACNALLADSTWRQAICNSTYFESVLNVKVPTMTSATTPSGMAFANVEDPSNPAWRAFDDDTSTFWATNASSWANIYCGYIFATPIILYSIAYKQRTTTAVLAKIEGSNDTTNGTDGTWTTILNNITDVSSAEIFKVVSNNSGYKAFRFYITSMTCSASNQSGGRLETLQFYGRAEVQTNIIHTAPNDTVYYKSNGSDITVCTADSDGIGVVNYANLPAGEITLYSTIAKDSENLSNDYSKTFVINANTTELWLMPDNALYWYGYEGNIEDCTSANGWSNNVSYTMNAPTHLTNYMDTNCPTNTNGYISAVSSKTTLSGDFKAILKGLTAVSIYGRMQIQSSKNLSEAGATEVDVTDANIKVYSAQNIVNKRLVIWTGNRRNVRVFALWYE